MAHVVEGNEVATRAQARSGWQSPSVDTAGCAGGSAGVRRVAVAGGDYFCTGVLNSLNEQIPNVENRNPCQLYSD